MKHWAPKPLRPASDQNGLFQLDNSVTVVNEAETPIQRQRRIDGTPHTVTGRLAHKPQGPELYLGDDKVKKSYSSSLTACDEDKKETLDVDAVVKAYLEKEC